MKYFLIAGEASGDLHASHLMASLKQEDDQAEFRFLGGDLMAAQAASQPILKTQKAKIDKLEKEKNDLEEQVRNLKGSAGTKEEEKVDGADNTLTAASELFNSIKDAL